MSVAMTDRTRQIVVAAGAAVAIFGAAWGSGAFGGTPIEEAAGGSLAPDATLLAAAEPAFRIWSVIYLGLVLFAVVQALPSRATRPRYRDVSWWILASMLLNAAWIAVVQAGWLGLSPFVLAAIVAVLVVAAFVLARTERDGVLDVAATEVTVGLYLGWASVATAANIAAAIDLTNAAVAIVLIAVVLVGVSALVLRLRRRAIGVSLALASAWGLTWVGVARLDTPHNAAVATTAFIAAALAVAVAAIAAVRPSPESQPRHSRESARI